MALTLVEAAKGEGDLFTRGVIETFIENMRITQVIPFRDIEGSADGISQEAVLPDAQTRGVNEAFSQSEGRLEEIIQSLKIYGGDIGVDPYITATKGEDQAARQVAMKIKAISNRWVTDFFKGDSLADPRDFDGLQLRLDGFNLIDLSNAALSLEDLDEAIARCHNPRYIALGRRMRILLTTAMRDSTTAGSVVRISQDEFGNPVTMYNELELIQITDNSNNDNVLDFSETASTTSIYVFGVGDEGIEGIQNGGFRTRNLGEDNTTPREDTRVEWYNNYHINHPRSAIRIAGIDEAAVTL